MGKSKKPKVTPIITGIHPQRERKILALHSHPNAIKKNLKDIMDMAEGEEVKNFFEDVNVLVNWALDRLPIVEPPKDEKGAESSEEDSTPQK